MLQFKIKAPKIKFPDKILTKQIMVQAGTMVVNNYKQRIARGKGVDNSGNIVKLKKLSKVTITNKGSNIPLVDTGRMKSAFRVDTTKTTNKKAVMNFPESEAWKAGIHQKGITIKAKTGKYLSVPYGDQILRLKKVTIPARPHVGFSRKDIRDALKLINARTLDKLEKGIKVETAR